jgi:acyl-[acyl-carrier-protein]-phospholipid O-acyltransferase/long-chain-fatty-acid--[acyl-carrier-protein] ligase
MRKFLRPLLRGLARLLFRIDVQLRQADFSHPHLLIVANHESFLDGLLIGLFLPIDPVFVVHTGIANNFWFRLLLSQVDYLAVDPTSPMAMKKGHPPDRIRAPGGDLPGRADHADRQPDEGLRRPGLRCRQDRGNGDPGAPRRRLAQLFLASVRQIPQGIFPENQVDRAARAAFPDARRPTAKLRRRKSGEAMRRLMQEMIFASRPAQTLYSALCDASEIHGRRRRLLEDVKQIEYSYNDLLKMALILGRQIERLSQPGERVGLLLPNLAPTLGLIFGLSARHRVPAMLNYTAGRGHAGRLRCRRNEALSLPRAPSSSRPNWPTSWPA